MAALDSPSIDQYSLCHGTYSGTVERRSSIWDEKQYFGLYDQTQVLRSETESAQRKTPKELRGSKLWTSEEVALHNTSEDCWVSLSDTYSILRIKCYYRSSLKVRCTSVVIRYSIDVEHTFNEVDSLTTFLSDHPGGDISILKVAGKDATQVFFKFNHNWTVISLERNTANCLNPYTLPIPLNLISPYSSTKVTLTLPLPNPMRRPKTNWEWKGNVRIYRRWEPCLICRISK